MARISAIVPAFNAAKTIEAALLSVLSQTYQDWEIRVTDDGSTDDTRQIVERLMPQFGGRLHYYYQENRGLPAARNAAIERASGEYFALLDSDDVWLEQRLERTIAAFAANPNVGLVHGRVARIDTEGKIIGYPNPSDSRFLSGRIARHIYTRKAHLLCPTVSFSRQAVEVAGRFDEQMRSTEDRDMWFRIAERFEVFYVDEVIAHYRISPNSMSRDRERMLKWQTFFNEKHRSSPCCGPAAYREAMANAYRERGDSLFKEDLSSSIHSYWKAVSLDPLNGPNLYMLGRALVEPALRKSKPRVTTGRQT